MSADPLLELVGVGKHFHGRSQGETVRAVDDVSLQIRPGETLGLVGESGCGKSTLARIALRLVEPTFGAVVFAGQECKGGDRRELLAFRRRVQAVFQNPFSSLNSRMTIRDIIAEPLEIHGVRPPQGYEARIQELLTSVGLPHVGVDLDKTPRQFSGGQLQRIAIARALALDPELIVADEPTSALDPSIQAQIVNLFLAIQKARQVSFLIISHDLDVVGHIADQIAVMYLGVIIEAGPAQSILRGPLHPYSQALLSAGPSLAARRSAGWRRIVLSGDLPSPTAVSQGCRFHQRCALAQEPCRTTVPALAEADVSGHKVACHFAPEATRARGLEVVASRTGPMTN